MLAIRRRRRLLEQDLQHTAEVVDVGRPAGADLLPEPGGAEAVDHRERHIHERGQDKYLRAAYVEQRLPHKQDVAGARIGDQRDCLAGEPHHRMRDKHAFRPPRRAGGVHDGEKIVTRGQCSIEIQWLGQKRPQREGARTRVCHGHVARDDQAGPVHVRPCLVDDGEKGLIAQDGGGRTMLQHIGQPGAALANVDRDPDNTCERQRMDNDDARGRIIHHDRDTTALPDA